MITTEGGGAPHNDHNQYVPAGNGGSSMMNYQSQNNFGLLYRGGVP